MTGWPILPLAPSTPAPHLEHGEVGKEGDWGSRTGNKSTQNARLKRGHSRSTFYRILHRIADLVKPKLRRVFIESLEAVQDAKPPSPPGEEQPGEEQEEKPTERE